jgi:hypothetical protein
MSTKTKSAGKKSASKKSGSKKKPAKKAGKSRKQAVGAGTLTQETPAKPKKPRPSGMVDEPEDVDEYELMRQAAVEPYRRSGRMPKPGAAGRLFDDEEQLEDYDPLFDDVGEEEDE